MRYEAQVGEDIEGSFQESKMSKVLMKLRSQKNINRKIQRENYELRMKLKTLEEEKKRMQEAATFVHPRRNGMFSREL